MGGHRGQSASRSDTATSSRPLARTRTSSPTRPSWTTRRCSDDHRLTGSTLTRQLSLPCAVRIAASAVMSTARMLRLGLRRRTIEVLGRGPTANQRHRSPSGRPASCRYPSRTRSTRNTQRASRSSSASTSTSSARLPSRIASSCRISTSSAIGFDCRERRLVPPGQRLVHGRRCARLLRGPAGATTAQGRRGRRRSLDPGRNCRHRRESGGGRRHDLSVIDPFRPRISRALSTSETNSWSQRCRTWTSTCSTCLERGDVLLSTRATSSALAATSSISCARSSAAEAGLCVHFHDISLPRPYPRTYFEQGLYWAEQNALQTFLAFNLRFEIVWPATYLMVHRREFMEETFPELQATRAAFPLFEASSF